MKGNTQWFGVHVILILLLAFVWPFETISGWNSFFFWLINIAGAAVFWGIHRNNDGDLPPMVQIGVA